MKPLVLKSALPEDYRCGVWWDIGAHKTTEHLDSHVAHARELAITDVAVLINRALDRSFAYTAFPAGGVKRLARALGDDISLVVGVWLRPVRTFIDEMLLTLPRLMEMSGARAVEFDVEANWSEAALDGFRTLDAAAAYLNERLRPMARDGGWEIGTTVRPDRPNPSISKLADYVAAQCFSVWTPEHEAMPPDEQSRYVLDGPWGPGGAQHQGRELVQALGGPRPVIGLAAWAQEFPGRHPHEAMACAMNAVLDMKDVREVRYWSWKWIAGHDGEIRNRYAYDFLRLLGMRQAP